MAELLYLGRDNTIDLVLKEDGTAVDLNSVTKITVTFGGTTFTSTDPANGIITWAQAGYDTGEIRLDLGDETITPEIYSACLTVYDISNPAGVVWGNVLIEVISAC